jgi:ribose 5-phosphate isomerase B
VVKDIFIASDHAGYTLKDRIVNRYSFIDLGTDSCDVSVDYNDFTDILIKRLLESNGIGILICKTGIGMSIAANRHKGIRAALCTTVESAKMTRKHNDANILVLPESVERPFEIVETFLETDFSNEERHVKRVKKLG